MAYMSDMYVVLDCLRWCQQLVTTMTLSLKKPPQWNHVHYSVPYNHIPEISVLHFVYIHIESGNNVRFSYDPGRKKRNGELTLILSAGSIPKNVINATARIRERSPP